jgi:hypothetical protein
MLRIHSYCEYNYSTCVNFGLYVWKGFSPVVPGDFVSKFFCESSGEVAFFVG